MTYALPSSGVTQRRVATLYQTATAITPTDNTQIGPFLGLFVTGAGTLTMCPEGQTAVVNLGTLTVGTLIPIATQGVNATGTTATVVGLG